MDHVEWGHFKDLFGGLAALAAFAWCTYLAFTIYRRKQKNDMQRHMLEKFSSAQDFAEFVQSPAGQKYVMSFSEAVTDPRNTMLNSLRTGIILIFLGGGLDATNYQVGAYTKGWMDAFGNIFIMTGTGFVIAGIVSHFVAKRMKTPEKE